MGGIFMLKKLAFAVVIAFPALIPAACSNFQATPIRDLLQNPRQFEDKIVTIDGRVVDSQSLLVIKYFTLEDRTGNIKVITERMLSEIGRTERIRGKLNEAFSIGPARMIVLVEEPIEK
jgi:hypothetical protein